MLSNKNEGRLIEYMLCVHVMGSIPSTCPSPQKTKKTANLTEIYELIFHIFSTNTVYKDISILVYACGAQLT